MAEASDVIDAAHAALVEVAELIGDLVDGECAGVLASLQRVVSTAQELQRRVMDRAVLRGEWTLDGFRSPARWAAVTAGIPDRTARRLRWQANSFRDLPAASAAALHGRLHDVQAHEIARCQRLAPDRFDTVIDQTFTTIACSGDLAAFTTIVRDWHAHVEAEQTADPNAPAPPVDQGSFHLSESIDGRWFGQLELSPHDGQFVASAIERGVGQMLHAKREGDPSLQDIDIAAMRARALVDLVDQARRLPPGRVTAPDRYHVALTIDTATYDEITAALAQERGQHPTRTPVPATVLTGMSGPSWPRANHPTTCESDQLRPPGLNRPPHPQSHGPCAGQPARQTSSTDPPGSATSTPLWSHPPHRLRSPLPAEALCDCSIYRLVLGAKGEPLDVGRAQRTWPAPMRNAIAQRDGGCRYPYCTAPIGHCDIHHCTHWEHGGHTTVTNGIALCRTHHTYLHTHHWTVQLDHHHQQPTFTRPDGTTYPPAPLPT